MKTVAALAAGVLLSLTTFIAGVFGTAIYLSDMHETKARKSADVSDLWTLEPVVVSADNQRLERTAAVRSVQKKDDVEKADPLDDGQAPDVDAVETGSTSDIEQASFAGVETDPRHIDWCMTRYNSYRMEDDTYQPYHGVRRRCNSPYQDMADSGIAAFAASAQADSVRLHTMGDDADGALTMQAAYVVDEAHARKCSARYRSYRFEDNTYQPLSGGPRRQCR